jgi:aldose 1-epimerase
VIHQRLLAGSTECVVDSAAGGRLLSLSFNGTEILSQDSTNALTHGCYPMVPFAGRVRDGVLSFRSMQYELALREPPHALHGTVLDQAWRVDSHTDSSIVLSTELGSDWPFSGTVIHSIAVNESAVNCQLSLHASEPMPAQVGWHPCFRTPKDVQFSFQAMLQRDVSGICTKQVVPVPRRRLDDCLIEPNSWPRLVIDGSIIEIESDCSHWVIFHADNGDICIEPQSGPPNGINSSPFVVEPGTPLTRHLTIRAIA